MTREEALKSMTIWPAFAAFQEHDLGSLSAGKYADFVVLDQDIMRAPVETILATHVPLHLGRRQDGVRGEDDGGDATSFRCCRRRPRSSRRLAP